jgi:hypothetical protein
MRNSKYYRKLFIYGVLISVLPIMTFGIFSYVNAREFIVQKAIQSERAALRQLYWNTESTIVNIDNTLSQAAYSTLTINAMLNSNVIMNYETYKSILALKNKADEMQHYLNTSYNLDPAFFVNTTPDGTSTKEGFTAIRKMKKDRRYR